MNDKAGSASNSVRSVAVCFDCVFPLSTGGAERVYRRVGEILADRGVHVSLVTRDYGEINTSVVDGLDIKPIWKGEIYNHGGVRTVRGAAGFSWALFRYLGRNRHAFDSVIVSSTPVLNLLAARLALVGTSTVVVADWLEVWTYAKWREYSGLIVGSIAFILQSVALRVGNIITVNSAFTAARVKQSRSGTPLIVWGLVDLVNEPLLKELPQARSAKNHENVLFVGRHIADKQIDALIRAFALLVETQSGLELRIVGDGPETPKLKQLTADLGITTFVRFLGRVPDSELEQLLAAASVMVNPSRREGFGLVVPEAAAHGTPSVVVYGADNAAVDLIEAGQNGFVAADSSPPVLAQAIESALAGGLELRRSTEAWFARERLTRGLATSVDALLSAVQHVRKSQQ